MLGVCVWGGGGEGPVPLKYHLQGYWTTSASSPGFYMINMKFSQKENFKILSNVPLMTMKLLGCPSS